MADVLKGVAALGKGLQLNGATKGIANVQGAVAKTNFNPMMSGISQVSGGFSALQVAGVTALSTIVHKAVTAGGQLAKSLTLTPIMQGFQEYELKMKSIQTIMANTAQHGTTLATVNSELQKLNTYADKTIYNFAEMTKNASLFTNSGMKIEDATQVIKGFSNAAAASGTGANEAARAAFQLSQGFAKGKITLEEWRSLTNSGMGSANMKKGIIDIATAMDTFDDAGTSSEKVQKDFNLSLQDGWLTADVMSTYLQAMTGDMTDAELAAKGLGKEQIASLQAQAKMALDAATKVRTFTQFMGALKEAVASGWATSFETIFGGFTVATEVFTAVSDAIGGAAQRMGDSRNKILADWKALGGRTAIIDGIKNAWVALTTILGAVKGAFRQIFPAKTGQDLATMSENFRDFTEKLKMGAETTEKVKRIFAGFFAGFSIIGQILSGAIGLIGRFFDAISGGGGGLLNAGAGLGMFIVNLDLMMRKSGIVKTFFDGLGDVLAVPLKLIGLVGAAIGKLFSGFDTSGLKKLGGALDAVGERLSPLQKVGAFLRRMFDGLVKILSNVGTKIAGVMDSIGDAIAKAFSGDSFSKILDVVNTGLLGGLVLMLRKFFTGGGLTIDMGDGVFDSVKGALNSVTEAAKSMQAQIKADTLMKIAIAIAILSGSLLLLSTIDSDKLTKALVGVGVGFAILQGALVKLAVALATVGMFKIIAIGMALSSLAKAILLMSIALKILSTIPAEDMVKAILGLGGALLVVAAAMKLMPTKALMAQSTALVILGAALMVMAGALKLFSMFSWEEMGKGLAGVAGALTAVALGMRLMPKGILLQAAALIAVGAALVIIAGAMKIFAGMSMEEIGKGLGTIAGALIIIAAAMTAMPPTMILLGPALIAVGLALNIIAGALAIMGGQSIGEMAIGLGTLAGALAILAIGLTAMSGALPGAAALVIAAGALMLLTPVLITLGTLSYAVIITGLLAIAGIFAVLGAAGYLLAPVVPIILALAAAMVLIGAGMALAGVGVAAFAAAFGTAVVLGAAGVKVLGDILMTFIKAIPAALAAFGRGIVAFASAIAKGGAAFFNAFSTILGSILKAISSNIPKIGALFLQLIDTGLRIIVAAAPKIANAGLQLILRMLAVMSANVGKIVTVVSTLIVNFLNALSANMPRVIQAGVTFIITFVNSVANAIRNNSAAMGKAGANLATAVVEGMAKGLGAGIKVLAGKAADMARSALNAAKRVLGIKSPSKEFEKVGKFVVEGFVKGLTGDKESVNKAFDSLNENLKTAMTASDEDIKQLTAKLASLRASSSKTSREAADRMARLRAAKKKDARAIKDAEADFREATAKSNLAIKETTAALAQAKQERHLAALGHRELTTKLVDEKRQLEALSLQYDAYEEKIKEADKALQDAIKTRDDYEKSLATQLGDLPDISKDTKLSDYIEGLQAKIVDTQSFATAIQQLRTLGLNDELYKELLAKGVDALPFINQLLTGGKTAVDEVNNLSEKLSVAAKAMGVQASRSLYQAGVDAAQGLVNGIKSQQSAVVKQMEDIAEAMLRAMKAKLGIKSPSREFAALGRYSVQGLAKGLEKTELANQAGARLGEAALSGLRKSISGMSTAMDGVVDLNPVITPVLDLTSVARSARGIDALLATRALAEASFTQASSISAARSSSQTESAAATREPAPTVLKFEQHNHSPKALSAVDIYRKTKSQISMARKELESR